MCGVIIDGIFMHDNAVQVWNDSDLNLAEGVCVGWMEPSVICNSTFVRTIVGLEQTSDGSFRISDRMVDHVAQEDCDMGG